MTALLHGSDGDPDRQPVDRRTTRATAVWRTALLVGLVPTVALTVAMVRATSDEVPVEVVDIGSAPMELMGTDATGTSWGAVIENTGDEVAYDTTLRLTYRDPEGNRDDSSLIHVPVLDPGHQVALGGDTLADRPEGLAGPVTDVELSVEEIGHGGPDDSDDDLVPGEVRVDHPSDGSTLVTFRVESGAPVSRAMAAVIFRDQEGDIVGSIGPTTFQPTIDTTVEHELRTDLVVPWAATAEVYAHRLQDRRT